MEKKNLLPILTEDMEICDGFYINCEPYCKKNCKSSECQIFYQNLIDKNENGFFTCPNGLSTYVMSQNDKKLIFTSFRERNTYSKSKAKLFSQRSLSIYNPILNEKQICDLINQSLINENIEKKEEALSDLSHEVKKLNAQIKEHSDVLLNFDLPENVLTQVQTIYACSSMIVSRFSIYDYERSSNRFNYGCPFECNVYKKFDKICKVLRNYKKKNVRLNISGNSFRTFEAYTSFEIVPLLLIDNAIKYTLENNEILINFKDFDTKSIITIESYSIFCPEDELDLLFKKGKRGKNATKINEEGSGLGLYCVKAICDLHNIDIKIFSDSSKINSCNSIEYAPFIVTLKFNKLLL